MVETEFGKDVSSDVRICWVLAHDGGNMTNQAVAAAAGMSQQLSRYQLKRLVRAGVVLRGSSRRYSLQPFFHDDKLVGRLHKRLHPLIGLIAPRMDYSYVDSVEGRRDIALVNSLRMFLAIAGLELRDVTLMPPLEEGQP